MATLFEHLGRILTSIKGLKIQADKTGLLVNLPVTNERRQTVKVTARQIKRPDGARIVARFVSRAGFVEDHVLVRRALEFNAGKQRFALCINTETDPPALDAVTSLPIDVHDEQLVHKLWRVIRDVGAGADNLERQLGGADDL